MQWLRRQNFITPDDERTPIGEGFRRIKRRILANMADLAAQPDGGPPVNHVLGTTTLTAAAKPTRREEGEAIAPECREGGDPPAGVVVDFPGQRHGARRGRRGSSDREREIPCRRRRALDSEIERTRIRGRHRSDARR